MDFVHNPYRCGPVRVGMYVLDTHTLLLDWCWLEKKQIKGFFCKACRMVHSC